MRSQGIALKTRPRPTGRVMNLSALLLFVVFAVVAYDGVNVIAFEGLEGRVDSVRGSSILSMLEPVRSWENTAGVATRARNLALDIILAEDPTNTTAIKNALGDLAKASPTSGATWQASVAYQQAIGVPVERVLAAFRMSALVASHEGYLMVQRAIFGLDQWTQLPEVDRRTAIRDVLATVLSSDFGRGTRYRTLLAAKSDAERDDIRAALTASGRGTNEILLALGL
jgi:hypothetical protein